MAKLKDVTNTRYGHCVAVEIEPYEKGKRRRWKCRCDCGNYFFAQANNLQSGNTTSCGCMGSRHKIGPRSLKHGISDRHPLYYTWVGMKARCYNPNSNRYERYGARGVTVCDEWRDDFKAFYDWAIANGWTDERNGPHKDIWSIERLDVNKEYSPDNCKWIRLSEQASNKTSTRWLEYEGRRMCIAEWAREIHIPAMTLTHRINAGWSVERALTEPLHGCHRVNPPRILEYAGEKKTLAQWGRDTGIGTSTIAARIKSGWSVEDALTIPAGGKKND